jgi:hypothetical protein
MMEASAGEYEINQKFCGGPGGGFSKEPPGRRNQYAGFLADFGKSRQLRESV